MVGKVRVVVRDFTLLVFFLLAHSLVTFRSFRVSLFFSWIWLWGCTIGDFIFRSPSIVITLGGFFFK